MWGGQQNYNFNTEEPFIDLIDAKTKFGRGEALVISLKPKKTKRNRLTDLLLKF
jgi:hypothetical protein